MIVIIGHRNGGGERGKGRGGEGEEQEGWERARGERVSKSDGIVTIFLLCIALATGSTLTLSCQPGIPQWIQKRTEDDGSTSKRNLASLE